MKKLSLLALAAAVSLSSAASALTEGAVRGVAISGVRAGIATFIYVRNYDGPTGSCAYLMLWGSPFPGARAADCAVRELKMLGQTSCLHNRLEDLVTSVSSVVGCWGFDQYGLVGGVSLVLAESDAGPTLSGLAVFQAFPFLPQAITID